MTRIYHPQSITVPQTLQLTTAASSHVARVLRMRAGDALTLFDGAAQEYSAVIQHIERNRVSVKVLSAKTVIPR